MISRADNAAEELKTLLGFKVIIKGNINNGEAYFINSFYPPEFIKLWDNLVPIIRDIIKNKLDGYTRLVDSILRIKELIFLELIPISQFYHKYEDFMKPDGTIHRGYNVYFAEELFNAYKKYVESLENLITLIDGLDKKSEVRESPVRVSGEMAMVKRGNVKRGGVQISDKMVYTDSTKRDIIDEIKTYRGRIFEVLEELQTMKSVTKKDSFNKKDVSNLFNLMEELNSCCDEADNVTKNIIRNTKRELLKMIDATPKLKGEFETYICEICENLLCHRNYHVIPLPKVDYQGLMIKDEFLPFVKDIYNFIIEKHRLFTCSHYESFERLLSGKTSFEPIIYSESVNCPKNYVTQFIKTLYEVPRWTPICSFIHDDKGIPLKPNQIKNTEPKNTVISKGLEALIK